MKRWLAWILTIALMIGVMPLEPKAAETDIMTLSDTAVACVKNGETEQWQYFNTFLEALAAAEDGDTIELLKDIADTDMRNTAYNCKIEKNITLSGGTSGRTIKGSSDAVSAHLFDLAKAGGEFTVENITFEGIKRGGMLWNVAEDSPKITFNNVTITDCTFTNEILFGGYAYALTLQDTQIVGNTIKNAEEDKMFSSKPTKEGTTVIGNNFVQSEGKFVRVGENEYDTFSEAYNALEDGGEIILLRDGNSSDFNVPDNITKKFTINGAGHIVTANNGGHLFNLNTASFTVKNIKFWKLNRSGIIWNSNSTAKIVFENVEISDCTFGNYAMIGSSSAEVTLKNTKILNNKGLSMVADPGMTLILQGETKIIGNTNNLRVNSKDRLIVASDFNGQVEISGIISAGEEFATVQENYELNVDSFLNSELSMKPVLNEEKDALKWDQDQPVAKIGAECYDSLQEAVSSIQNSDLVIIELLRDVTIKELLGSGYSQIAINDRKITIKGNGYKVTHASGTNNSHVFQMMGTTTLTIENMVFDGLHKNGLVYFESGNSTLTLKDVTVKNFTLPEDEGKMLGQYDDNTPATVTLIDTVFQNNKTYAIISNIKKDNTHLILQGNTIISGNTRNDSTASNIWIGSSETLTVEEDFSGRVGITAGDEKEVITRGNKFGKTAAGFAHTDGLINDKDSTLTAEIVEEGGQYYLQWKTKQAAQILCAGEVLKSYETLSAAIEKYEDSDTMVIQMLADTKEADITLNKTIYLDLNGHTVTANISGSDANKLHGFDSTTDGFRDTKLGAGKIIGTVTGAADTSVTTNEQTGNKEKHYIKIVGTEGVEFHRYYVGVSKVRFWLDAQTDQSTLEYTCYVQGDGTVLKALAGLGFKAYESADTSKDFVYLRDFSNIISTEHEHGTGKENGGTNPVFFKAKIFDGAAGASADDGRYTTEYKIQAALRTKDDVVASSGPVKNSFMNVVKTTYSQKTSEQQKEIEQFLEKHGLALEEAAF